MRSDELPFFHPWEQGPLKRYADVIVGGTPSTEIPRFWGGDIRWMASGDIHLRNVFDVPGRISEIGLASSNAVVVPPTAVAMALAGQGKTRGTVALTHVPICANQSVALIKPRDERLNPEFLFQSLIPRYEEMRGRSAGGGRAGLTKGIIEQTPIQVPTPKEQQQIAEVLTTVDEAIEQTEALIAKTQQIKAGLMHDLFARGVTPDGHLRPPRSDAPQLYRKESPLGWIPKEWKVCALRTCLLDNPTNGIYKPANLIGRGTLLVGQAAFTPERSIDYSLSRRAVVSENELRRYGLAQNNILVSRVFATVEGVGQPALVPPLPEAAVYESNMMRLRVDLGVIRPRLLFEWLRDHQTRRTIVGGANASNQCSVNQGLLNSLPILMPPLDEQDHLLRVVEAYDERYADEQINLRKVQQLKQGLMQDLLTGRVPVARDARKIANV